MNLCHKGGATKRSSPVETGELNDCLPYEKFFELRCLVLPGSFIREAFFISHSHSQCNFTPDECAAQANFSNI